MKLSMLSLGLVAALVLGAPSDALADRDHRNQRWDRYDNWNHWDRRHQRLFQRQWRHNNRYWRNGRWIGAPRYYYGGAWGVPRGYVGGALLGSALTYGAINNGRYCDDDFRYRGDVRGCYRIERLPNGRERRVELPPSACR